MNPDKDPHVLLGRLVDAATDLCHLATANQAVRVAQLEELLWKLYEGLYGHRKAEHIDPFKTAVGGALEVKKAWDKRTQPEAASPSVFDALSMRGVSMPPGLLTRLQNWAATQPREAVYRADATFLAALLEELLRSDGVSRPQVERS